MKKMANIWQPETNNAIENWNQIMRFNYEDFRFVLVNLMILSADLRFEDLI